MEITISKSLYSVVNLAMCYAICHGDVAVEAYSCFHVTQSLTRGHECKLSKQPARVNAIKLCIVNESFFTLE